MLKKIVYLLFGILLAATPVLAAKTPRPGPNQTLSNNYRMTPANPTIKVLLVNEMTGARIRVDGPYRIFNPDDESVASYGLFGKDYPVVATQEGVKWGEEFPGVYQIAIVPANARTQIYVDDQAYPGTIFVYQVGSKISIINQVKIEDYLKATLPLQLEGNMNEEAIAAAAIVARTDAYYQTLRYPKAFWNVEAKDVNYIGLHGIRNRSIDQAVDATKYLVMRLEDNPSYQGLFPATWTAHSAGKTALASVIFRKPVAGPTEVVQSPLAQSDRESTSWNFLLKRADFARAVGVKELKNLSVFKDNGSGKVYGVRIQSDAGAKEVDFLALQKALGKDKLQSSDFTLDLHGDIISIEGHGRGHGVGLCLYSANRLAEHGQDAVSVLGKFFPGAHVVMMPTVLPSSTPVN